jgi:uncharacterized membrane protein YbhN (UPF0104 family)
MFGHLFSRQTRSRWLLGVALLAGLLAWVQHSVGWGELLAPWRTFPPGQLALLLGLTALSYLFRAVRVYDYATHIPRGAFPATLRLSLLHNTLNNFLPMRLGELAYPLLMKRYFGQDYTAAGVTLIWIRLLDLHFLGLLALIFLHQARPAPWWPPLVLAWAALVPAVWWGHGWLHQRLQGRGGRLAGLANRVLGHLPDSPARLARVWLWTLLSWGLKFWSYTTVVLYFADIGTWRAVFGTIGAELSSVLPLHGVAGSGSYELAMTAVLLPLGLDLPTILRAAVNLHLYLLGASLLLGLAALGLPRPAETD